jgi:hypothetical protein
VAHSLEVKISIMKRTLINDGRDQKALEFGMVDGESNSLDIMPIKQRLSSSSECCTTFDWAELGSCLKRVKISVSSPGEIRLSTDLNHLTHQCGWSKKLYDRDNDRWYCYRHPTKHLILTRDPVDFLRLKLVLYEGGDECCFFIQFPRMYPHSAPEIYRLSSNPQKKQTGSQQVQTIEESSDEGHKMYHAQTDDLLHNYQYKDWTPIRRLHDIIEWLILLPHFQCNAEDEIMMDNEYPIGQQILKYQQEGSLCTDGNVKNNDTVNSTVEEQQPKQQYQGYSYSNTSLEIEKTDLWLFNQSRFDVGFVPLLPPSSLSSTQSKEDIMM